MDRRSRHRIRKIEERLSAARGRREPLRSYRPLAWHHATAVAAIVLSGQPKVDEPLNQAWTRALQHYQIDVNQPGQWNSNQPGQWNSQVAATRRLLPKILEGEREPARFTKIFSTAPVWLLQFTGMAFDARLLKFHLPDISQALTWGSDGFEDARRWPLLPLDMMTAGDPIPQLDGRQLWIFLFCRMTSPDFGDDLSQEDEEDSCRHNNPLLDDICFSLDLDGKPEKEWSRYEKRRMRRLSERISRL